MVGDEKLSKRYPAALDVKSPEGSKPSPRQRNTADEMIFVPTRMGAAPSAIR